MTMRLLDRKVELEEEYQLAQSRWEKHELTNESIEHAKVKKWVRLSELKHTP